MSETESSLELTTSLSGTFPQLRSRIFKIIVIGDSGVGKTCLTYRLWTGRFPEKTEATIGVDFREKVIEIEGEKIRIQLWDTAGQERFRKSMVQHYYRNAHAIFFVYDVTNAASFHSLPIWMEECRRHSRGQEVPRILIGNKRDLRSSARISAELARKFAEAHRMPFFETSAKSPQDSDRVEAILITVAQGLKNQKPLLLSQLSAKQSIPPSKRGSCSC
ncbi:RAB33B, member RAS oncogene family a [Brienomyrus brachyistius]|uniref:RAB33B, member RAS oncogene family a n=1 Tax=Brienomyrus brachyistius TaxID=42636 RepID=UPI0020B42EFB|nr:RAB33B, member RAS oncogene family a [Brienomyrus brachyistius]